LKDDIQNHVPDPIDHTNIAFQSTVLLFIVVDWIRYTVSTFLFWHSPSYVLLRKFHVFCAGSCTLWLCIEVTLAIRMPTHQHHWLSSLLIGPKQRCK
jgi:hypothetical protein